MNTIVHLLSGLAVGGKERVALKLARRARQDGLDGRLLLFDTPFRDEERDFDPGDVPVDFLARGPGLDWRFPRAVGRWLDAVGADVLHAHNDTALFYGALAARSSRRRPRVVATLHTRPSHPTRAGRLLTRWASKRLHAVTAVSDDLRGDLLGSGWLAHCETVWNGVDLDLYRPDGPGGGWRSELEVPGGARLVANVGRLDPLKRQQDLIEAVRRLAGGGPEIVVVFAGQGPTLDARRAAARDVPGVRFVPCVRDVAAFLRDVDVFVLCSREEAAPLVLLEAMACGRAIVATDVGGVRHMLTPDGGEPAGRLVPHSRPDLLARELRAVCTDDDELRSLGVRARLRAADFSEDAEWAKYLALYRE